MKRILFLLAVVMIASASAFSQKTYTLITAISNYDQRIRPECPDLPMTTDAAKRLQPVLKKQSSKVAVLTGKHATHDNILAKLRGICAKAGKNDRVIFYYGGHGGAEGCLSAYDKNVYYTELVKIFSKCKAKYVICFFDACYSGSSKRSASQFDWTQSRIPGLILFTSSRANEASIGSSVNNAGYFTNALINGLRGQSDKNHDRNVTALELFTFIHGDVKQRSGGSQNPQLITNKENRNVIIARW